jgi:methylenetetrahydrofolate dehydrogenase (NADP+)/methenyltetrahydrofolate cyclohydrolase
MSGVVLDGKKINADILNELRPRIDALRAKARPPALAVVLVGDDPASHIYVRNKIKACEELGIRSLDATPPATISTGELLDLIQKFNNDPEVDGILVQSPLPKQIDSDRILLSLDPGKDADGFHPFNVGSLVANRPAPRACTPAGIIQMLKRYSIPIAGKRAVVVGRSDIVGKPVALMLLHENATVTVCHSKTRDLAAECRRAEILIAAIGKPALINADYLSSGAVVIDVGMNRITDAALVQKLFSHDPRRLAAFAKNGNTLVGDVEPFAMQEMSAAYTPVPGGVGPLTIAMLMANTVRLAEQHLSEVEARTTDANRAVRSCGGC